jgi:hypothetical protein
MAHPLEGHLDIYKTASVDGDDRQQRYVVLSTEATLVKTSKYNDISVIEDIYIVSHPHDLSLPLLAADVSRRPHTFNCNG